MADLGTVTTAALPQMQAEVAVLLRDMGWNDPPVSFGEAMALLHSEVSEALEAYRRWGLDDHTDAGSKPEGVGSEFADVLIRLLADCEQFGVDLTAEYERKMAYNRIRPWRHGGKRL